MKEFAFANKSNGTGAPCKIAWTEALKKISMFKRTHRGKENYLSGSLYIPLRPLLILLTQTLGTALGSFSKAAFLNRILFSSPSLPPFRPFSGALPSSTL
jgi:hypothetical protein